MFESELLDDEAMAAVLALMDALSPFNEVVHLYWYGKEWFKGMQEGHGDGGSGGPKLTFNGKEYSLCHFDWTKHWFYREETLEEELEDAKRAEESAYKWLGEARAKILELEEKINAKEDT